MPFCSAAGRTENRIDWPDSRQCSADQIVVGIERAGHLALRDRMIPAVRHVLFARPQQLDRRARHLLGDRDRLADIVGHAAPAEAAAEHHLVHVAFFGRQAGGFQHRGERRFAVLRAAPDLAFVRACRARWRSSAPSWRGSGRDSCRPPRPSWRRRQSRPWRRRSGCRHRPAAHCRGLRPAISRSTRWRPWRSRLRPRRSAAHRARSWRATRYRRRRRPRCRRPCTTFLTPFMPAILASSKLFSLPPNTGQSLIAALSMPGSLTSMP